MATDKGVFGMQANLALLHALKPDDPTQEIEEEGHLESGSETTQHTPSKVTLSNFFQHPDTHPFALDFVLQRKYGPEFLLWAGETLEIRIPQDFKTTTISDLNISKIQAMRTLHLSHTYWQRWEVFNWCTMSLNHLFPDFEVMQVPTVPQCLISCDIARRVDTDTVWSDEVKAFVSTVFFHEGVLCPIEPCNFVSFDTSELFVDAEEVKKHYADVIKTTKIPKVDPIVEEQLRRVLHAHLILEENRTALRVQLRMIDHGLR